MVKDDTLANSVADYLRMQHNDLHYHGMVYNGLLIPPLAALVATVASGDICHCYPKWYNFPVYI